MKRKRILLVDDSNTALLMDGLEACRRLRGHDATRAVPIIMVTTRAELRNPLGE